MQKAEDCGGYYRIPADTRDLNYEAFFSEGTPDIAQKEDYHSHNTQRLNVDEMADMLSGLPYVQDELKDWRS